MNKKSARNIRADEWYVVSPEGHLFHFYCLLIYRKRFNQLVGENKGGVVETL